MSLPECLGKEFCSSPFWSCFSRDRPKNRRRITAMIRLSIMRWYRSLLAVRGPAPAARAAIPNNTPPKATKLVVNAIRHRILQSRKSAVAPNSKKSPHRNSTIAAGMMSGSWNAPSRRLHVERRQRKKARRLRSSTIPLRFLCGHLSRARWISNSFRQHEPSHDQPDKAGKSHHRDEKKSLRENQVEPTQFTSNRQQ